MPGIPVIEGGFGKILCCTKPKVMVYVATISSDYPLNLSFNICSLPNMKLEFLSSEEFHRSVYM